jgi:hypothetical protein
MTRRVLFTCAFLYGTWLFVLACTSLTPYPELYDNVYDAGSVGPSQSGSGGATGDGSFTEDAVEDGEVMLNTCPTGANFIASASNPQELGLDSTSVYWANAPPSPAVGSLASAARGGGAANTLISGLPAPVYVVTGNGYVAVGDEGSGGLTGTISLYQVSSLTTSTPGSMLASPEGIAIDSTNVYWVSNLSGGDEIIVESAPLGGGAAITLGTLAGYESAGLAVSGGTLYFAGVGGGGGIFSMPTGGGSPITLQTFSGGEPTDVRTDGKNVYWSDIALGGVYQSSIGGGAITTLASGLMDPTYIAIDSSHVYTADFHGGEVYEMTIGTSDSAKKIITTPTPIGIAADDTDSLIYFTSPGSICSINK